MSGDKLALGIVGALAAGAALLQQGSMTKVPYKKSRVVAVDPGDGFSKQRVERLSCGHSRVPGWSKGRLMPTYEVGDLVTCRTCKKKAGSRSIHLPFGTELEHPVWGQARIIGRYDRDSWEARNRWGQKVIRDRELPEWRITYMPDVPAEEEA